MRIEPTTRIGRGLRIVSALPGDSQMAGRGVDLSPRPFGASTVASSPAVSNRLRPALPVVRSALFMATRSADVTAQRPRCLFSSSVGGDMPVGAASVRRRWRAGRACSSPAHNTNNRHAATLSASLVLARMARRLPSRNVIVPSAFDGADIYCVS